MKTITPSRHQPDTGSMPPQLYWLLLLLLPLSALILPPAAAASQFTALAFHDVVDTRRELTYDAVTVDHLIGQLEWLKLNNYHPVSIDDLIAAREGRRPLPERAVLLCWDDAYTSFFTRVLPLLKAYKYPAVLAVVGSWVTPDARGMVQYGDQLVPRDNFMSWPQLQEAASSGLVEIASHSDILHNAILADPSGDRMPAAIARRYDTTHKVYETELQYNNRLYADLQANSNLIQDHLGFQPRVMVWPFGRYNEAALRAAARAGMTITLTLNPVPGDSDTLTAIGRIYPTRNPDLLTFRSYLNTRIRPAVRHFFKVDSRELVETDPDQEKNFGSFLNRVKDLSPSMVLFEPVVETDGVTTALFRNSRFPVAQDRLNRLSWHTDKRVGTTVSLWLSSALFTPGSGETEAVIDRFFSDMGQSAPVSGLVVDTQDVIPALLNVATAQISADTEVRYWNPDRQHQARQALLKQLTAARIAPKVSWLMRALESFQQWQPFLEIGFVLPLEQFTDMETAQFTALLNLFDFLIIDLGNTSTASLSESFKGQVQVLEKEALLRKCAFLLSTEGRDNPVADDLRLLPDLNIINWGYRIDRFQDAIPLADSVRQLLSKEDFPYPLRK